MPRYDWKYIQTRPDFQIRSSPSPVSSPQFAIFSNLWSLIYPWYSRIIITDPDRFNLVVVQREGLSTECRPPHECFVCKARLKAPSISTHWYHLALPSSKSFSLGIGSKSKLILNNETYYCNCWSTIFYFCAFLRDILLQLQCMHTISRRCCCC